MQAFPREDLEVIGAVRHKQNGGARWVAGSQPSGSVRHLGMAFSARSSATWHAGTRPTGVIFPRTTKLERIAV